MHMSGLHQAHQNWPGFAPWMAVVITLGFTAVARWVRGVSRSGAIAGAAVCFILSLYAGPGGVLALVSVFALAWTTTRFGYQRKRTLGTAEKTDGRTASQVLANLSIAAIFAGLFGVTGFPFFLLGMSAALAEAAADTVSSELGQARNEKARLITTWEEVSAGTDGGITGVGTLGGILAAVLVGSVCVMSGLLPAHELSLCVVAAVFGMMADSYMGALLERRRLLNNDMVNFLGTLLAAAVAIALG